MSENRGDGLTVPISIPAIERTQPTTVSSDGLTVPVPIYPAEHIPSYLDSHDLADSMAETQQIGYQPIRPHEDTEASIDAWTRQLASQKEDANE
jgi:hypothetical protein